MTKESLFIGIDNGKHGATAIIDIDRNILKTFKYEEGNTLKLYNELKDYIEDYNLYAFVEKPIVVYGLAHQTAPFETIGRHKMTLEILKIPYKVGDPAATSSTNWKKIIGLFETAKDASRENSKEISALNKEAKNLVYQAEELGLSEDHLKADKIAYMEPKIAGIANRYREIKKKVAKLRGDKKSSVKQTSIDACLKLFPEAINHIEKSKRAVKNKYDDDIAEAILLAECGRTLYINGSF